MFFVFNATATPEIYTLSLHDALPILESMRPDETLCVQSGKPVAVFRTHEDAPRVLLANSHLVPKRSEEHTSELQSLAYLVCRLLLEKKKHYTTLQSYSSHR